MRILLFLPFIISNYVYADEWDKVRSYGLANGKSYTISSGTGFFISNNYIITNEHVVEQCVNISIRGAVKPSIAKLVSVDVHEDLALLYTTSNPKQIANIRSNDGLNINDPLTIVGYPLNHSIDGMSVVTKSNLIGFDSPITHAKQVEFVANIEHGNSGGPLLDNSGNVIGVIKAVQKFFHTNNNVTETQPFKVSGIAIGLGSLKAFLNKNLSYFHLSPSSGFVANYNIETRANDYIVNIHCIQNKNS
ncbi:MAG: serine protease [Alphaproteobacteria bacterium]